MSIRREELQKLIIKKELRPIAKSLGIRKYLTLMNKNELIDSILEYEENNRIFGGTYKLRKAFREETLKIKKNKLLKSFQENFDELFNR